MVTHWTRIQDVPGSNSGADQSDRGFIVVFVCNQGICRIELLLPRSNWLLFIKFKIIKLNQ